jgi:hypothetical protein
MLKARNILATLEESPLSQMMKGFSKWRSVLVRACFFWSLVILVDLILVYFFGSQFWSYAGYLFGNDARITLSVLLFIEGGILLVMGTLWASGSMDSVYYGKYGKTPASLSREDWKYRKEQTERPSNVVKILMLVGGLLLLASFLLLFA